MVAYILGTIGGLGFAFAAGGFLIGICVVVLGCLAAPTVLDCYKKSL